MNLCLKICNKLKINKDIINERNMQIDHPPIARKVFS